MKHRTLALLAASLAPLVPSSAAAQTTYVDGDFQNWSWTAVESAPGGSVSVISGGNPGNALSASTHSTPWGWLLMGSGQTWNPAAADPIHSFDLQIDVKSISGWGQGQAIYPLLIQGGNWFLPDVFNITGSVQGWLTRAYGPYSIASFHLVTATDLFAGGAFGLTTPGPDLSPTGAPIELGLAVANHISNLYTNHYDNWKLDVWTCTDKHTSFGSGLAGTGGLTPALSSKSCFAIGTAGAFDLASAAPNALGLLTLGVQKSPMPLLGGTLEIVPLLQLPLPTDAGGAATRAVPVPNDASLVGTEVFAQAFVLDPGAPQSVAMSNGYGVKIE